MSNVRELHHQAMKLAELAMVARHHNEKERAETLGREAFEYESQAAALSKFFGFDAQSSA